MFEIRHDQSGRFILHEFMWDSIYQAKSIVYAGEVSEVPNLKHVGIYIDSSYRNVKQYIYTYLTILIFGETYCGKQNFTFVSDSRKTKLVKTMIRECAQLLVLSLEIYLSRHCFSFLLSVSYTFLTDSLFRIRHRTASISESSGTSLQSSIQMNITT